MALDQRPWGPDVSHYQGAVDWAKVKAAGASFAFVKATDGLTYVDSRFKLNWPAIYKAGILIRGAYHYAHIESDPIKQARHFVDVVMSAGGIHRGDFLVLDAEDVCKESAHITPRATGDWCMAWLDEVVRLTGLPRKRILVYTGMWWWTPRAGGDDRPAKSGHPLWLSAYTMEAALKPSPWPTWRFWQYTDRRTVPGAGKVDASYFNGAYKGLWWLSGRPLRLLPR